MTAVPLTVRGLGGVHTELTAHRSLSGGGSLEEWVTDPRTWDGWVIDLLPAADREGFASAVIGAPLCNPEAETWEPSELAADGFTATIAANYLGRAGVALLAATDGRQAEPTGFDFVPTAYLVGYWRARGARIGQVRAGRILWEDDHAATCQGDMCYALGHPGHEEGVTV